MKTIWIINHYAIPPSLGGLNRHYYFKKELEKRGYNVRIFTASQIHNSTINMMEDEKSFCKDVDVDDVEYSYIKTGGYKGNGLSRIKNILEFAWKIKKIPKHYAEKPDVIYTSSPDLFTAYYAEKLAKKLKVPCIVEIRDLWPESIVEYKGMSRKNPLIRILYAMEKSIYKRAKSIVFTMEGGKQYITDKGWDKDIDLSKVYNINNGVDLELFEKNKNEFVIADDDLTNEETFKIVYCGSIRQANNVDLMIDVAKKFGNSSKVQFLLYGNGDEIEKYRQRCEDEDIKNIVFKGQVNKKFIPFILSKSNLNVLNYKEVDTWKYGGSQNKMFEYMASGKPILSTIKIGYSIIEKYSCGIEIDEQTTSSIYEAIKKISNLPITDYNAMCENAINGAKDFDFKNLTDKLIDVIEK